MISILLFSLHFNIRQCSWCFFQPGKACFLGYTVSVKKLEVLFGALRLPLDALSAFAAMMLSYTLRAASMDLIPGVQLLDPPLTLPPLHEYVRSFVLPGTGIFLVVALLLGLYAFHVTQSAWKEIGRAVIAALLWLVCIMAWYFLIRRELFYSRVLLMHAVFFLMFFVIVQRSILTLLYRLLLRIGFGVHRVVSIGVHALSAIAESTLREDQRYRYLGHIQSVEDLPVLHKNSDLDLIIQTDPDPSSEATLRLLEHCRSEHITYAFLPQLFSDAPHQIAVDRLGLLPMIRFRPTPLDGWGRVLKRAFDVIVSFVSLIVLSPLLLVLSLAIFIADGRPIFYVSRRVGDLGRKTVPVLKFRSMVQGADLRKEELAELNHRRGPLFKIKDDPRITPLGKFLRRWTLDELPQLFNVLIGHMSLVGPRPHLPEEVKRYTSYQRRVFAVRPGLTGLSQISGRSDLPFDEEVQWDLRYIEEWSLLLDLWILWRTVFVVMGKKGAD